MGLTTLLAQHSVAAGEVGARLEPGDVSDPKKSKKECEPVLLLLVVVVSLLLLSQERVRVVVAAVVVGPVWCAFLK